MDMTGRYRIWDVLCHGRRAPIRGRVCMNILMVDVTDIPEIGIRGGSARSSTQ